MNSNKKVYARPELIVHGNIETITQSGGGSKTDVPIGTPAVSLDAITS
jgi:hypothetical protein